MSERMKSVKVLASELHAQVGCYVHTYIAHNDWDYFRIQSVETLDDGQIKIFTRCSNMDDHSTFAPDALVEIFSAAQD